MLRKILSQRIVVEVDGWPGADSVNDLGWWWSKSTPPPSSALVCASLLGVMQAVRDVDVLYRASIVLKACMAYSYFWVFSTNYWGRCLLMEVSTTLLSSWVFILWIISIFTLSYLIRAHHEPLCPNEKEINFSHLKNF